MGDIVSTPPSSTELVSRGDQALATGQLTDAIAFYQTALTTDTRRPDTWYNLAWALRSDRQFEAALDAYANALLHGMKQPEEARLNRAAIFADHLYKPEAAEEELRAALIDAPTFIPALLNLGTLHEDLGQAEFARDAYRRAIAFDPGNGRANARLAMIDVAEGLVAKARVALDAALPRAVTPADRAEMLYAKAVALDADGQYDSAFETLGLANNLARASARSRYDPEAHERLVTKLIETFRDPVIRQTHEIMSDLQPIFIVGMFRSGSTLAEQLLARHSTIIAGGELEYIPMLAQSAQAFSPIDEDARSGFRSSYLTELRRIAPVGQVSDKRCDNIFHVGLIKMLFPDAPIIHTVRNPLDTLISILFLHFGEGVSHAYDQRDAAHYYIQYRRILDHWRGLYDEDIHDIDYDRVVVDPRAQIEPVLNCLGLSWENARPDQHTGGERSVRTASSWQVREVVHRRSSGRWLHYAQHLEPAKQMLADAGLL